MKSDYLEEDHSLQALLDLDGYVHYFDDGYWVKFSAHRVEPSKHIPHGIRYSLTFHDRQGNRIIGYDNAHDALPKTKKYRAKKVAWDHIHKQSKVFAYEFDTASQLITDFWKTVNQFS